MQPGREIHLRPHHSICLQNFVGKGYGDEFTQNMKRARDFLWAHEEALITVWKGCDDLCRKCPNREGDHCTSPKPDLFDGLVLKKTGLAFGDVLPFGEFRAKAESYSLYELDTVCPGCEWLPFCREIAKGRIKQKKI